MEWSFISLFTHSDLIIECQANAAGWELNAVLWVILPLFGRQAQLTELNGVSWAYAYTMILPLFVRQTQVVPQQLYDLHSVSWVYGIRCQLHQQRSSWPQPWHVSWVVCDTSEIMAMYGCLGKSRVIQKCMFCYDSFVFLWLSEGKEEYSAVITTQNLTRLGPRLPVPLCTAGPHLPHRTHWENG